VLLVSHDRRFLDARAGYVMELDCGPVIAARSL
jgi:ATPase subunit of ABC transporter with duplicated ATPase domains